MKTATISTGMKNDSQLEKRSDKVTFLKKNETLSSTSPNLYLHTKWIDELRAALEMRLDLKMEQCTFMLAEYPSGGTRYIKHRDAAPSEYAGRKLTALFYLNAEWSNKDGGELHLWPGKADDEVPIIFEPIIDRLILFKSYMEHEVQPSFFHRIALTTWFVNRRHQALELMCEHLSLKQDEKVEKEESQNVIQKCAAAQVTGSPAVGNTSNDDDDWGIPSASPSSNKTKSNKRKGMKKKK